MDDNKNTRRSRPTRCLAALLFCALLCSCASGQSAWHGGASSGQAAATEGKAGVVLAEFIGKSGPGAHGQVADHSYGSVQVSVGESYVSALGESCRKAEVIGGSRLPQAEFFASCQGDDGAWRLVPPVLPPVRILQGQK